MVICYITFRRCSPSLGVPWSTAPCDSVAMATAKAVHPESTHISPAYTAGGGVNTEPMTSLGSHKLNTVSKSDSIDLFNQYNDMLSQTKSLTLKRLPPVKVSYTSKNKFVESLKGDLSSKILRPHLTINTTSPGHHIFTEGISRNSALPDPTFALQKIGVPYSNLPDNISIFKEKDKYAFGIRTDEDEVLRKSPYRLTPKPFGYGQAKIITDLEKKPRSAKLIAGKKKNSKYSRDTLNLKNNVIKLEPILKRDKTEIESKNNQTSPVSEPIIIPSNSIDTSDSEKSLRQSIKVAASNPDDSRRVSVVSIGMTVSDDFCERSKRETRQKYPMYDHKVKQMEQTKRDMLTVPDQRLKPKQPTSTFTYKISTRGMTYVHDDVNDKFKPIRNNLRDKYGNLIHKQRSIRRTPLERESSKCSSDYNFRRYYSQGYHVPHSAGSSHGTDLTHVPGNPPPSIISQQEESGAVVVNDLRSGMVTLYEENTMMESRMSNNIDIEKQLESDRKHVNSAAENEDEHPALMPHTNRSKAMTVSESFTTDTEVQFQTAMDHLLPGNNKEYNTQNDIPYLPHNKDRVSATTRASKETGSVHRYIAEAEERIRNTNRNSAEKQRNEELTEMKRKTRENYDSVMTLKSKGAGSDQSMKQKGKGQFGKQLASIPTVFETSFQEAPVFGKEKSSLSRTLQTMTLSNSESGTEPVQSRTSRPAEEEKRIHVKKLTLFSEGSGISVKTLPESPETASDATPEDKDIMRVDINYIKEGYDSPPEYKVSNNGTQKKVVANATLEFVYPACSEVKAKRQ